MKSCHITTTYLCVFNWSRHLGTWLMERKRYMVQNPHCTSHKKMLNLVDLYGNRCRRRNKWRGGRRLLLNCLILWFTAGQYRSTKTVSFKINILTLKKKFFFGVPCLSFSVIFAFAEIGTERACYRDMSSFPETKAEKFATRTRGKRFLQYNRRQLSRVYPRGQRLDSSNYDPLPMWLCGSQLVALNFQTPGQHLLYVSGANLTLRQSENGEFFKMLVCR